jgi:CheY-like chemotaxis protein
MQTKRILILEDDLETISTITKVLAEYENDNINNFDIAVTVLSESSQVEEYVNKLDKEYFDLILLDRDCKACGSFHVLDFKKFDVDKIISISSTPEWNEEAKKQGVKTIVRKDYANLEQFAQRLV